jgi:hypothetical protein
MGLVSGRDILMACQGWCEERKCEAIESEGERKGGSLRLKESVCDDREERK